MYLKKESRVRKAEVMLVNISPYWSFNYLANTKKSKATETFQKILQKILLTLKDQLKCFKRFYFSTRSIISLQAVLLSLKLLLNPFCFSYYFKFSRDHN